MIYVYRRCNSLSAKALAIALEAVRAKRAPKPQQGDVVVCWGEHFNRPYVKVLNGTSIKTKFTDARLLTHAGVETVAVAIDRGNGAWLPRRNNHMGGHDLLQPGKADYWVEKEDIVEEYRIHCFLGKSIRAGKKVPMTDGGPVHAWVRTYDAGWRLRYRGFKSTLVMRKLAVEALKALELDFGAVDIGKKADGKLLVLEVNRAPGIEGRTVDAYANAVRKWMDDTD